MRILNGIQASPGIAIAKAYRLEEPEMKVDKEEITNKEFEIQRFREAIQGAKHELEKIMKHTEKTMGADKAEIIGAHLLVLEDPELLTSIEQKIDQESVNAEYATREIADMFISMFEAMENEYMKERAADIRDVTKRVIAHLLGVSLPNTSMISEPVIIVANDLTPSDTAQLNRQFVKGFVTGGGGRTSHSAIMARSLEIPAVVGTKTVMEHVKNGEEIIIDGFEGKVIIDPPADDVTEYERKELAHEAQREEWRKLVHKPTVTEDGTHMILAANIGTPQDIASVLENGSEGIGLYRTEFLYMGRDQLPTEEEQFEAYRTVLESMAGKPVVVRTLDIGGDKELPYLNLSKELNPFLGLRAIRLCFVEERLFRIQLRALWRASVYGNLKVMFPMIATLDEFRQAKAIFIEEKEKLQSEGIHVADRIEVGMMVETPSSAVMADLFAKEVDFFSIGTNDLIQYTMAADRMNENVSYLYQPYHPAILRLINHVIQAAHKEDKWVGVCGELAGDSIGIPLLLTLGVDELSMSATSILPARSQIKNISKDEAASWKRDILHMKSTEEVVQYVKERLPQ